MQVLTNSSAQGTPESEMTNKQKKVIKKKKRLYALEKGEKFSHGKKSNVYTAMALPCRPKIKN